VHYISARERESIFWSDFEKRTYQSLLDDVARDVKIWKEICK